MCACMSNNQMHNFVGYRDNFATTKFATGLCTHFYAWNLTSTSVLVYFCNACIMHTPCKVIISIDCSASNAPNLRDCKVVRQHQKIIHFHVSPTWWDDPRKKIDDTQPQQKPWDSCLSAVNYVWQVMLFLKQMWVSCPDILICITGTT